MKTEKVFASIFFVGLIFYFMHWPFAGPLLVVSLSTIAMLYFPGGFYFFCDKNIERQNLPISVISGFFLSFIPVGVLFKLLFWPNPQIFLLVGIVTAPVFLVLIYFSKSNASEDLKIYYRNMFLRVSVLTILVVTLYLTPITALIQIRNRHNPELAKLKIQHFTNPENEEYKKQLDDYVKKQDSLEIYENHK